ncbi:MAG: thioredoxin-dependent thiol peroxidase [Rhodospirillales bacterium]|nr:thioredoxin-dependent thiol peroxidase [Alphaproteobacteria bacterium]MCB9981732.1 thioredoxin-dependent thiol peroxidase [Rhodospirillales bacterium]
MTELKVGDPAPNFTAPTDGDRELSLSDFKGQKIVLYFYPKDDTPGCTKESCGFNEALQAFKKLGTTIIGISKDSPARHDKFKAKYNLNFPLVSDENTDICERYGVWKEKNMYGKKYMGIERSTFLIDEEGKIAAIWRKVKVDDHVEEVQKEIRG